MVVSAVMQAYLVSLALVVLPLVLSTRQRLVSLERARAGEERFRRRKSTGSSCCPEDRDQSEQHEQRLR